MRQTLEHAKGDREGKPRKTGEREREQHRTHTNFVLLFVVAWRITEHRKGAKGTRIHKLPDYAG